MFEKKKITKKIWLFLNKTIDIKDCIFGERLLACSWINVADYKTNTSKLKVIFKQFLYISLLYSSYM